MKILKYMKDGGPESRVHGFFLIEIKSLFSIVLLHFEDGSRDAYHNHAFHAISWLFRGKLIEHQLDHVSKNGIKTESIRVYEAGLKPIITPRSMFHKVVSAGDTWALSFRGPWNSRWREYLPSERRFQTLTHGRKVVA